MSRWIDADAVKSIIRSGVSTDTEADKDYVCERIDEAPSIDIVQCKDCRHRDPENKKCDCGHDIMWQLPRTDEWFCADGERRKR